jgi:hypothetical protein
MNPEFFPLTPNRRFMERLASRFRVLFLMVVSVMCASLSVAVLLATRFHVWGFSDTELASIKKLPQSVVFLAVGLGGFSLFFPWFLALYCVRWVLSELARIDQKIATEGRS